ncbi:MAG: aminotransferase class V-fold PLP-dependent enzyme [Cyanobacteriota bacterium]|nr:aminotransferase class V-fold PLP-dependent enzyme [Cyanobacteriota bacterium]
MSLGSRLRERMPALAGKTYFNYGGQGPLPTPSLEAMVASWCTIQELGPFTTAVWPFVEAETNRVRSALAALCGVGPHRLALTENVTSGCVLPLWGLPWQSGDQLLISDCEHPGVVAACQELARREGLVVATLPLLELCCTTPQALLEPALLDQLERHLAPNTRLVALSHLLWNTGSIMPITAVAHRLLQHPRQPWLLVDAAQSVGCIPVADAAPHADIYGFTGHKWCCGPEGLGGVALSERVLEQAQPTLIGWRSLRHEGSAGCAFHADARRFEIATSCVPLCSGLATSLELLAAEGSAAQRLEHICSASERFWQGLQRIPGARTLLPEPPPAGLVSFSLAATDRDAGCDVGCDPVARNTSTVVNLLGEQGIWLRRLDHPDCLRACTHITTTDNEVDRLLAALARLPIL